MPRIRTRPTGSRLLRRPGSPALRLARDRSSSRTRVPRRETRVPRRETRASMAAVRRRDRSSLLPRRPRPRPRRVPAPRSRRRLLATPRSSRRSRRAARAPRAPRAGGAGGTAGGRARASRPGRDTRRPTAGVATPPRRRPRSSRPRRPGTSRCRCRRSTATRRPRPRVSPRSIAASSLTTGTTGPGSSSAPLARRRQPDRSGRPTTRRRTWPGRARRWRSARSRPGEPGSCARSCSCSSSARPGSRTRTTTPTRCRTPCTTSCWAVSSPRSWSRCWSGRPRRTRTGARGTRSASSPSAWSRY